MENKVPIILYTEYVNEENVQAYTAIDKLANVKTKKSPSWTNCLEMLTI
jgi:hypothetical protein